MFVLYVKLTLKLNIINEGIFLSNMVASLKKYIFIEAHCWKIWGICFIAAETIIVNNIKRKATGFLGFTGTQLVSYKESVLMVEARSPGSCVVSLTLQGRRI